MSASPHVLNNSRDGFRMGDAKLVDTMIVDGLWDVYNQYHMGVTAENVAKKYDVSRAEQDEFALQSQLKAEAAQKAGKFKDEIIPLEIPSKKGAVVFDTDEYPKHGTTLESLAGLRPAFNKEGTRHRRQRVRPERRRRRRHHDVARRRRKRTGPDADGAHQGLFVGRPGPDDHGHGPGVGHPRCACKKAGWTHQDVDLMEINEAFAAQAIAVNKRDGLGHQQDQRQRRRHRARPPDRRIRRAHPGHPAARNDPARRQARAGQPVHRRRHGRGTGSRARLIGTQSFWQSTYKKLEKTNG